MEKVEESPQPRMKKGNFPEQANLLSLLTNKSW